MGQNNAKAKNNITYNDGSHICDNAAHTDGGEVARQHLVVAAACLQMTLNQ